MAADPGPLRKLRKLRVLVVDDSAVVRQLVSRILNSDPQIEVVGTAADGHMALSKTEQLRPDIITLDVDMPHMGGIETLATLRRRFSGIPVIMFSSLTDAWAAVTVEALALGAADYVYKPSGATSSGEALTQVRDDLLPKLKAIGGKAVQTAALRAAIAATPGAVTPAAATPAVGSPPLPAGPPLPVGSPILAGSVGRAVGTPPRGSPGLLSPLPPRPIERRALVGVEVLCIGASTGGPNALSDLLTPFPADLPVPVLIVQHMPPLFTRLLAERLSAQSGITVHEATHGEPILPGHGYVAPGNFHLDVQRQAGQVRVVLHQGPQENSCRPAVDVMFRAAAQIYGPRVLAVILTGMGQDGLRGAQEIRGAGGQMLAQDEASSVVWGMPGAVVSAGLADRVLPLADLGGEVLRRIGEARGWRSSAARSNRPLGRGE